MNRRNFLKAFTGATVGAAVIAIIPPLPETVAAAAVSPMTKYQASEFLQFYINAMLKKWQQEIDIAVYRDGAPSACVQLEASVDGKTWHPARITA